MVSYNSCLKSTQQQLNTINLNTCRQCKSCSSVKISTALRESEYSFCLSKTNELSKSRNQSVLIISKPMSLTNLQTAPGAKCEASFHRSQFLSLLSFDCLPAPQPLNIPNVDDLVLSKVVASNVGHDWRRGGGNDEDSTSESSFGSSAVCCGGDMAVSAWFSS